MKFAYAILIGLIMTTSVQAAKFTVLKSDQQSLIVSLKGEIKFGDPAKLQLIAGSNLFAKQKLIYLDSVGGLVQPALETGLVVRSYRFTTVIAERAQCLSACSMIFVAGRSANGVFPSRIKFKGSRLGVHRPFYKETGHVDP